MEQNIEYKKADSKCIVCGTVVSKDNLGVVVSEDNLCCNNKDCIENLKSVKVGMFEIKIPNWWIKYIIDTYGVDCLKDYTQKQIDTYFEKEHKGLENGEYF